jgi:enoyl-CoA hydratase/carnithine racemase
LLIILIQAVVMAREMILLGEKFDAKQAQSWGLPRDVIADKVLMPALAKRPGAFIN